MSTPTPPLTEKHALIYKEIAAITQKGIQLAFMQGVEAGFNNALEALRLRGHSELAYALQRAFHPLPPEDKLS